MVLTIPEIISPPPPLLPVKTGFKYIQKKERCIFRERAWEWYLIQSFPGEKRFIFISFVWKNLPDITWFYRIFFFWCLFEFTCSIHTYIIFNFLFALLSVLTSKLYKVKWMDSILGSRDTFFLNSPTPWEWDWGTKKFGCLLIIENFAKIYIQFHVECYT